VTTLIREWIAQLFITAWFKVPPSQIKKSPVSRSLQGIDNKRKANCTQAVWFIKQAFLFLQLAGKTEANFYVGFLGQFPRRNIFTSF
jgi:hypothetical protein